MKYAFTNAVILDGTKDMQPQQGLTELAGLGAVTGTVEAGKRADLIVTAESPLEDLRALRHVELVMARGRLYEQPRVKERPKVTAELDKFLTD